MQQTASQNDHGLVWLLKHAWYILTQGYYQGRISRGEFWISSLLLSLIFSIITFLVFIVLQFVRSANESLILIVSIVIALINLIIQAGLIIRRAHDLDKSGWWILKMVALSILLTAGLRITLSFIFYVLSVLEYNVHTIQTITNRFLGLLTLIVLLLWGIIPLIKLYFYKGTSGDNQYGVDPLEQDQVSNTYYWIVGIVLCVIGMISSIGPNLMLGKDTGSLGSMQNFDIDGYKASLTGEDLAQFEQLMQNDQDQEEDIETQGVMVDSTVSQTDPSVEPTTSGIVNS